MLKMKMKGGMLDEMASMIERTQTEEEKKDYNMLGKKTPWERFLASLSVAEHEFALKHMPFDSACAKLDYRDLLEKVEKEAERGRGFVTEAELNNIKIDFKVYGRKDRFELMGTDKEMKQQLSLGGSKVISSNEVSAYVLKYVCKERGHGCSVFLTPDEYELMFKKDKKEG